MNNLSSGQRKLVYMGGILLLMVVVILLGQPSSGAPLSGGVVSDLREEYSLGEATLGKVDPASSTMNLVLLGFRGIAASILWSDAEHYRMTKNWSQLQQSADSITLLQPHFKKVWEYQAWNLGFNVSSECDAVEDRFFWVKQGAKYLIRGTERNTQFPELDFECGRFFGQKIGRADEKEQFRKFFVKDPDTARWEGKGDGDINPESLDNYKVAKQWYLKANKMLESGKLEQHKMDLPLFVAYPYHSQMDYAAAREEDGNFDNDALGAWATAYTEWTQEFGKKTFAAAGNGVKFTLEANRDELQKMSLEDHQTLESKLQWQDRYHATINYKYWKMRCEAEQKPEMINVRRDFYLGKIAFKERGDMQEAGMLLERGLKGLQAVVDQFGMNGANKSILLASDEFLAEDAVKSLLILERVRDGKLGDDFPLKALWDDPDNAAKKEGLRDKFKRWAGEN